ncbi:hypothetical protein HYV91_01175 [Candidatus Wolfebacteria bacterium]|nr:hypothetical protein [Candidatus Wolfebacteria bacterium]
MVSSKFVIGLLLLIFFVHLFATINFWYWTFRWFDIPMHFLGGFWVAMVFFWLIYPRFQITNYQLPITIILLLAFVALVGVLWEFFEFIFDLLFSRAGYTGISRILGYGVKDLYIDTLKDLFMDLLGGLGFFFIQRFAAKAPKISYSSENR